MYRGIGLVRESSLHASIKRWYYKPGDLVEVKVGGRIVDLLRGNLCIEFQTRHLYAIQKKVQSLLGSHAVRIVYPMPVERIIVRIDIFTDQEISRRKSPLKGTIFDIFNELVRISPLAAYENFSLEILFIREEMILVKDDQGSWKRKGWSIIDRRLIEVLDSRVFLRKEDYRLFVPADLVEPFSARDLASAVSQPIRLARKMVYSLSAMGILKRAGKKGRAFLYARSL